MKILILNGSPKGKYSITLHTLKYLEIKFPNHSFEVIHVGQQINKLMKDMSSVTKAIQDAGNMCTSTIDATVGQMAEVDESITF